MIPPQVILALILLTIALLLMGALIAVLWLFRKKSDNTLHLFCNSCGSWHFHTPVGPQLDEKNQVAFYLYNCSSCGTTRAVK